MHHRTREKAITGPLPLRLTEAAEADLAEIWACIASEASESIATNFVRKLEAALDPLCQHPFSGPARGHLAPGLRVAFHGKYAIYYLAHPDELVILRVVHGARDIVIMTEGGGFV